MNESKFLFMLYRSIAFAVCLLLFTAQHDCASSERVIQNAATRIIAHYVYVSNYQSDNISQFQVAKDGSLHALIPAQVKCGAGPIALLVDSKRPYLYVANSTDTNIQTFKISANGQLTSVAVVTADGLPGSLTLHPSGVLLYVANAGGNDISRYLIHSDGRLTLLPQPTPCGNQPLDVAFTPDGHSAFTANGADGTVSQFTVQWDGSLIAESPPTAQSGATPQSLCIDRSGSRLFVVNNGEGAVSIFGLSTEGVIKPEAPFKVHVGQGPRRIVQLSDNTYCVCNLFARSLSILSVDSDGNISVSKPVSCGYVAGPEGAAVDSTRRLLFVTSESNDQVLEYDIDANGTIADQVSSEAPVDREPVAVAVATLRNSVGP